MNFTLKTLVAAAALVAAGSANAALVSGADTGNIADKGTGELFLAVLDTVTQKSFVFDFTPIAGNDFTMNSFAVNSTAAGQSASWTVSGSTGWTQFAAATAGNQLVWQVAGIDAAVDYDNGFDVFNAGQERIVSTVKNGTTSADLAVISQGNLDGAVTKTTLADLVNAQSFPNAPAADPAVFFNDSASFNGRLGAAWGGNFVDSSNLVGATSKFYSITGGSAANAAVSNGKTAATAYAGTFTFNIVNGAAVLAYNVPVASVPESDTYAMLLAGLGVMGLVARRRLAA